MGTVADAISARTMTDTGRTWLNRACLAGRAMAVGFLTAASVLAVLSGSTSAAAQDLQALLDRIERLERDIRTLNIQLSRGAEPAALESDGGVVASGGQELTGAAVARFDTRMTALEEDVRAATGAMEEVDFRIRTIEGKLNKIISDIEFRISELEQGRPSSVSSMAQGQVMPAGQQQLGAVPSTAPVTQDVGQTQSRVLGTITETDLQNISSTPQTAGNGDGTQVASQTTDQNVEPVQSATGVQGITAEPANEAVATGAVQEAALTPKEQYTIAFGLLRQAKYDDAAVALQAFIAQNPDDELTPNARYWLGETYYVRSEFVSAAEVFFEAYRLAPTAAKAPDTLLKLGMALGNLDKKVEACAAFGKVAKEFPNASSNVRTTLERERLRNGC